VELVACVIEQGIVMLVQAGLVTSPPTIVPPGGFYAELPKDLLSASVPQAWTYDFVNEGGTYTHDGPQPLTGATLEIVCHGYQAKDAINLAKAINQVLSGYKGTLPDPDHTQVSGIFSMHKSDFFSDQSRTYRRVLGYHLWYGAN
jgi:hypothetical protein